MSVNKYINDHNIREITYTGEHLRPVSSLLKGFIRRKTKTAWGINKKTKLNSAVTENFFQRIGDLLEQGQIILGNIVNIALENSTNLWKYDIWYTSILDGYEI